MRNYDTKNVPRANVINPLRDVIAAKKRLQTLRQNKRMRYFDNFGQLRCCFASNSSKCSRMAKPFVYLNSPRVGDQADMFFITEILFVEKSKNFHLHFWRGKFSFLHLKRA